jgi:hypothetical protein
MAQGLHDLNVRIWPEVKLFYKPYDDVCIEHNGKLEKVTDRIFNPLFVIPY